MNDYNKAIKYQTKINLVGGDNVYIFKPNGFKLLVDTMVEFRRRLPEDPVINPLSNHIKYINWADHVEAEPMIEMINVYICRFSEIWEHLYDYIAIESQEFYTRDYRLYNNEDILPKDGFAILKSIYNEVNRVFIDYREMCQLKYRPHSHDQCVNAKGEHNPKLLHWSSVNCANDTSPAYINTKNQQVPAGCGLNRKNNCTFHHMNQNKFERRYNNNLFIDRRGFITLPNGGHWFNAKPFV